MDYAAYETALTDHGFSYVGSTTRYRVLNDVVADVCSREPWPFLEASINLTFDGSSAAPTNLPSNLLSVLSIIDTATGMSVAPLRIDEFEKRHQTDSSNTGIAQEYYFDGDRALKVWQIPTSTTTLRMKYLKYHPTLSTTFAEADLLIPARHHPVLIDGCLWKLHRMADSLETAGSFKQDFEERLQLMRNEIWMRQYDRPDHIQVLDTDFHDYY